MAEAQKIPIGADHAGFDLKERLKQTLVELGYQPEDVGTFSSESVDYPDFAKPVAQGVSEGEYPRGILICGSGLGMSYAANRYDNVRAAVVWSPEVAELSRRHNDSNILVLPSRFVSEATALEMLKRWLETPFDGGRHENRVKKIERSE